MRQENILKTWDFIRKTGHSPSPFGECPSFSYAVFQTLQLFEFHFTLVTLINLNFPISQ